MNRSAPHLALLLALSLCVAPAQARIVYHWIDAAGGEHFSDTPVAGAKQVWVPDSVVVEPAAAAGSESPEGEDTAALGADDTMAEMCESRTAKLKELMEADRIIEEDALGNERVLSATERTKLLQNTRADVKLACGK